MIVMMMTVFYILSVSNYYGRYCYCQEIIKQNEEKKTANIITLCDSVNRAE